MSTNTYQHYKAPQVLMQDNNWNTALKTLQINPGADFIPLQCPHELLKRHNNIEIKTRENNLPVRFLGYNILPNQTCVYPGEKTDWAIMSLKRDPTYYSNGKRMIVPGAVAQQIKNIVNAGVEFDAIYVAHEIPKSSIKPGQDVPIELIAPPAPPEALRRVRKLSSAAEKFWKGIGTATVATAASFTLPLAFLGTADPVLFGVNINEEWRMKNIPIGMWYFIARWEWKFE